MPRSVARQYLEYLGARTVAALLGCLGVEADAAAAGAAGALYCRLDGRRRQRAEQHIAQSFPGWDRRRVAQVAERSMQYMIRLFAVEVPATPRLITPSSWPRYVRFGEVGPLLELLVRGEPMILVTGHCGNWELLGQVLAVLGYPVAALARPLDNRFLNRWILGLREARGTRVITKWGAVPQIEETLRCGGRIGFIADQNAGDQGLFVPFFGRLASSYKSIGLLAMRYRVPIAAGFARRLDGPFGYEVSCTDLIRPEEWERQPDPLFYITARYNHAIEQMIRIAPEQYLWVHRRWKSRPRHERLGRPLPAKLREKIRSLPWMSQAELDAIASGSERAVSAR